MSARGHVYCFQKGSEECYKIGRTHREPERRRRNLSTGSSEKLIPVRDIETDHAAALEIYLHNLLDDRRADNGEFFNLTLDELDTAINKAQACVTSSQPLLNEAKALSRQQPSDTMVAPSEEMRKVYRQLRAAYREQFFLEQRITALESRMQVEIGANGGIAGLATWNWISRSRLNTKLFRGERPDLYDQYKCDASRREFRLEQADLRKFPSHG
jgi:hypothetical protein